MTLSTQAVGLKSQTFQLSFDWRTVVLYALGIGAEPSEIEYLYEAHGPRVYPSFAVVPTYPVLGDLLAKASVDLQGVVHSAQSVRVLRPLPPEGVLQTEGVITGVYDLKRMGQIQFTTQTSCEGQVVFETEWTLLLLTAGGFGGPRPPRSVLPRVAADEPVAFRKAQRVAEGQALLYRLSGDFNPLHVDAAVARQSGFDKGPILHGLATYGYCLRALSVQALGGEASRITEFAAQFRKPVWPGETLVSQGYRLEAESDLSERFLIKAHVEGRDDELVAQCVATVTAPVR